MTVLFLSLIWRGVLTELTLNWTPEWTDEVKEATYDFLDKFNLAEKGGHGVYIFGPPEGTPETNTKLKIPDIGELAKLAPVISKGQVPQIWNIEDTVQQQPGLGNWIQSYIGNTEEDASAANSGPMGAFNLAEIGEPAKPLPVITDVQAPQIENTYNKDAVEQQSGQGIGNWVQSYFEPTEEVEEPVEQQSGQGWLRSGQVLVQSYIEPTEEVEDSVEKQSSGIGTWIQSYIEPTEEVEEPVEKQSGPGWLRSGLQSGKGWIQSYFEPTEEVASDMDSFNLAGIGERINLAPVNTDVNAIQIDVPVPQIENTYIEDTEEQKPGQGFWRQSPWKKLRDIFHISKRVYKIGSQLGEYV